ncbi:MAG: c-type cytochrome [Aestuariivirga sp.]
MRGWLLAISLGVSATSANAADDPGAKLFKGHCGACHVIAADGKNRQGPILAGVLTRKAATQPDFTKYSAGLKAAGWDWTPEQLDLWLTDPKKLVPDTTMSVYRQKDAAKRKLIIEHIKANGGM